MSRPVQPKNPKKIRQYKFRAASVPEDDSIHDELMFAFDQYFRFNLRWMASGSRQSAQDARYWLLKLKKLASDRRKYLLDWRYQLDGEKWSTWKSRENVKRGLKYNKKQ